jgi:hypothetical protein
MKIQREQYDIFEYIEKNAVILWNRRTGEFVTNGIDSNRRESLWKPIQDNQDSTDKDTSISVPSVWLTPCTYASRKSCRKFYSWADDNEAASHVASVVRGFLSRQRLRKIFKERFYTSFDPDSGFVFFVDGAYGTTSWTKPLLAFPGDILPYQAHEDIQHETDLSSSMTTPYETLFSDQRSREEEYRES